jgi:hypothetical protein
LQMSAQISDASDSQRRLDDLARLLVHTFAIFPNQRIRAFHFWNSSCHKSQLIPIILLEDNMRYLTGIAIAGIAALIALYLAIYTPWRTGAGRGEKDSTGGLNTAQDANSAAPAAREAPRSARGVRRSARDVQQPAREVKDTPSAKRNSKSAKPSTAKMRRDAKQRGEDCDCELQDIETPDGEQWVIDVMLPAEDRETTRIESEVVIEEFASQRRDVSQDSESMKDSSDWPSSRRVILTVPERQECSTPREVWVEVRGQ